MRKIYRKVLRSKNVDLKITRDIYDEYFSNRLNYKGILLKFLTRTQTIIINKHYQVRNSLQNFKKKKSFKNKLGNRTNPKQLSTKSDETTTGKKIFCYNSTNDHKDTNDKSNELSKSNPSYLSDNEVVVKNKMNFLKVLKNVTTNMLQEIKKEGKQPDIVIEPQALPELDLILSNKDNKEEDDKNEEDKQEEIKVDDIVINLNLNEENKIEENNIPGLIEKDNMTLSDNIKKENDTVTNVNTDTKRTKDKNNCSCKCIIY